MWDRQGSLDVLDARARLGPFRAADLDAELEEVRERLAAFPDSGAEVKIRGEWSTKIRRVSLSRSPYRLFYRVNPKAERVVIFSLRHNRRRNPKM